MRLERDKGGKHDSKCFKSEYKRGLEEPSSSAEQVLSNSPDFYMLLLLAEGLACC